MPALARQPRLAFVASVKSVLLFWVFLAVSAVKGAAIPLGDLGIDIPLSGSCYTDAVILYSLATYIVSNYAIHATTIPVGADIGRYSQRVTRQDGWQWNIWLFIISLFLPFFALSRTSILIAQQIRCHGNGVLVALQHGGITVVVRNPSWAPGPEDQIVFVRLPEDFESQKEKPLPPAKIILDKKGELNAYEEIKDCDHKLHGIASPPTGYSLAVPVRRGYTELLIKSHLNDTKRLTVHHRPGVVGGILSLIQIGIGTYDVYSAQSSQIPRWGYASYSLSVLPYVIMSVMNLLCAVFVDSYSCAQLLRTPILEESLFHGIAGDQSGKTQYDGTIGTVKKEFKPNWVQAGDVGQDGYIAVRMRTETDDTVGGTPQRYLVVETTTTWRRYRLIQGGEEEEPADEPAEKIGVRGGVATKASLRPTRFTVSALYHEGPPPQDEVVKTDAITRLEMVTLACLFLVAMIVPHAVTFALTHFHANHSTVAQRAWMMAWLAADQFSAFSTLACWVLWKKRQNVIPGWIQKCFYGVLLTTGVGGFVQVGHMYLQDHNYGLQKCSI